MIVRYERPLRPNELYHYGILGMKWGVRRYQNPDGSLTSAGRKRYNVQQKAISYADRQASDARDTAKGYREHSKELAARYSGKDAHKKYLQDMYGNDWKDKAYMKDVFEVYDVEQHGREMLARDLKDEYEYNDRMAKSYDEDAKKWENYSKSLRNTNVSEISTSDLKKAKEYAKKYDDMLVTEARRQKRYEKRQSKNAAKYAKKPNTPITSVNDKDPRTGKPLDKSIKKSLQMGMDVQYDHVKKRYVMKDKKSGETWYQYG